MNKSKYYASIGFLSLFLFFNQPLLAEARIELRISSEKIVDGKTVQSKKTKNNKDTENPDTQQALPGEQLLYTIHYENLGKHSALEAVINTTIDEATLYKDGSASCENCNIVYSIDGEHFDSNDKLNGKPETYKHIRWLFHEIVAGEEGQVSYSVVVK